MKLAGDANTCVRAAGCELRKRSESRACFGIRCACFDPASEQWKFGRFAPRSFCNTNKKFKEMGIDLLLVPVHSCFGISVELSIKIKNLQLGLNDLKFDKSKALHFVAMRADVCAFFQENEFDIYSHSLTKVNAGLCTITVQL